MSNILPAEVESQIERFMADGKTGSWTVDIVDGSVNKVRVTESLPVRPARGRSVNAEPGGN